MPLPPVQAVPLKGTGVLPLQDALDSPMFDHTSISPFLLLLLTSSLLLPPFPRPLLSTPSQPPRLVQLPAAQEPEDCKPPVEGPSDQELVEHLSVVAQSPRSQPTLS